MSDNIRNFNDYRKKIIKDEQATEEINIEIQDPLDFLSADEREEYYRTQHEAMDRERESLSEDSDEFYLDEDFEVKYEEPVKDREPERRSDSRYSEEDRYRESDRRSDSRARESAIMDEDWEPVSSKKERKPKQQKEKSRPQPPKKEKKRPEPKKEKEEFIRKKHRKEVERRMDDSDDDYDDEGNEFLPLLIVRISSIITGVIILVLIGMILKNKVYDSYFAPEPDEETTTETVVGELAGYTKTGDKIVTTADLNLRNTPSTASDDFIVVQVPQGTVLDRVAVSDDGEWAQVQYEDQLLFCVMKYATVQE